MNLPRLHPEDLKQLSEEVSKNVMDKLEEILTRNANVSEMQTLTIKEVAKILNKDETTILRYVKKKLLKASKPGKNWIITQQSLTNYIENGTVKS